MRCDVVREQHRASSWQTLWEALGCRLSPSMGIAILYRRAFRKIQPLMGGVSASSQASSAFRSGRRPATAVPIEYELPCMLE